MHIKPNNYKEALSYSYNIMAAMTMPNGFVRNKKNIITLLTLGIFVLMIQNINY